MAPFLIGLAAVVAALIARWRHRLRRAPARAVIVSPRRSTVIAHDGAVHSVQSAELTMDPGELERLWTVENLENLARTYWSFLSRVTLRLIRIVYGEEERRVVLLVRPLTLLRFDAPEYGWDAEHASVRWRIRDGFLVARAGRGKGDLKLDVWREADDAQGRAKLRVEVGVTNFYPSIAAGFSEPVYEMTQSFVHVLVTHSFLRSLATLELQESRVRRLAETNGTPPPGEGRSEPARTAQP